jgi:hypothetical protein
MDDLDRLFALLDVISKPEAAIKNAAEAKRLREVDAANKLALKAANAAAYENTVERDRLAEEWVKYHGAMDAVKADSAIVGKGRLDLESARLNAIAADTKRKDQMKTVEDSHAKKISELTVKQSALEEGVLKLQERKALAEADLDKVRQRISA